MRVQQPAPRYPIDGDHDGAPDRFEFPHWAGGDPCGAGRGGMTAGADADDRAAGFGGHRRPGHQRRGQEQQGGEEGEGASGGGGAHRGLLQSDEVVESGPCGGCPHVLWITSARSGTLVKRNAGLRRAAGLRGK